MEYKKKFLFKYVPQNIRNNLKLDEEAYYSVTDQTTADTISNELLHNFPDVKIITDGTACIGGNTYSFSKYFKKVQAIEIDKTKFDYLQHNINCLGINNVELFNDDVINKIQDLEQDMIFIDPPWGGPNYKDHIYISLNLSGIDISSVCELFKNKTKYIALKVPINFNIIEFEKNTKHFLTNVYKNIRLRKMFLLVYKIL
jgi:16S rRNA G966 N2-methylase RsmD